MSFQFKDRQSTCKKIIKTDKTGTEIMEAFYAIIIDEGVTQKGTALNADNLNEAIRLGQEGYETAIVANQTSKDALVVANAAKIQSDKAQINSVVVSQQITTKVLPHINSFAGQIIDLVERLEVLENGRTPIDVTQWGDNAPATMATSIGWATNCANATSSVPWQ